MEAKAALESITDHMFPSGFHVMVIDDDPICSSYVTKIFHECRFKVTSCDPNAALDILRETSDTFHLLLIKVHMSDIDAFSLLQQTRRVYHLPALMLTLIPTDRVSKKCLEYPDCHHLTFPINVTKLIDYSYSAFRKCKVNNLSRASQGSLQQAKEVSTQLSVPPLEHFVVRGTETEQDIRRYRSAQLDLPPEVKKSFAEILDELESHLNVAKKVIGLMHKGESSGTKKDREPPAGKK